MLLRLPLGNRSFDSYIMIVYSANGSRGQILRGARGIKPPYLLKIHGYPSKPHHYFWDETMKKKRGGREREGEEEEES